jgi:hypothetical protein
MFGSVQNVYSYSKMLAAKVGFSLKLEPQRSAKRIGKWVLRFRHNALVKAILSDVRAFWLRCHGLISILYTGAGGIESLAAFVFAPLLADADAGARVPDQVPTERSKCCLRAIISHAGILSALLRTWIV